jgi:serine/threonine protein kinase
MASIDHPFILKLVNTYQDTSSLYMLLELVQGGELFSLLHPPDAADGVPESSARFYAACILEGLSYMHQRKILYRDLKPEVRHLSFHALFIPQIPSIHCVLLLPRFSFDARVSIVIYRMF